MITVSTPSEGPDIISISETDVENRLALAKILTDYEDEQQILGPHINDAPMDFSAI